MKIGLVITVHERPEYLRKTLESLSQSYLPNNFEIFMVNDNSKDPITNKIFQEFSLPNIKITKTTNTRNQNMFFGLKTGWDYFYANNFDILTNLDSDVIVKSYWLPILLQLHEAFPDRIVSGFNTSHHSISGTFCKYYTKKTIGGINCLFDRKVYKKLATNLKDIQWDWNMCHQMEDENKMFIVSNPSVIQHIGESSTLRDHNRNDRAEDWIN